MRERRDGLAGSIDNDVCRGSGWPRGSRRCIGRAVRERLRLREVPAFVCVRGADDDARHLKLRALIYDPTDTTGSTFGDTQDIIMDVYDSTEATNDYTHHQFTGAIRDQDVVWDDNYQGWDYV
ncbi:MAG: hypothetical protein WC093_10590 [Methanoculleus sp.]